MPTDRHARRRLPTGQAGPRRAIVAALALLSGASCLATAPEPHALLAAEDYRIERTATAFGAPEARHRELAYAAQRLGPAALSSDETQRNAALEALEALGGDIVPHLRPYADTAEGFHLRLLIHRLIAARARSQPAGAADPPGADARRQARVEELRRGLAQGVTAAEETAVARHYRRAIDEVELLALTDRRVEAQERLQALRVLRPDLAESFVWPDIPGGVAGDADQRRAVLSVELAFADAPLFLDKTLPFDLAFTNRSDAVCTLVFDDAAAVVDDDAAGRSVARVDLTMTRRDPFGTRTIVRERHDLALEGRHTLQPGERLRAHFELLPRDQGVLEGPIVEIEAEGTVKVRRLFGVGQPRLMPGFSWSPALAVALFARAQAARENAPLSLKQALSDEDFALVAAATLLLQSEEKVEGAALLVEALDAGFESMRWCAIAGLEQLTGERFGRDSARWRSWWRLQGADWARRVRQHDSPASSSPDAGAPLPSGPVLPETD